MSADDEPMGAPQSPSLSPLGAREFEFRIRYGDRVLLTCDGETYEEVSERFPEADGYVHEGRELTPWLPVPEVGAALIPVRSLMWDILERDAAAYERVAAGQKELMDQGNTVAMGSWSAYQEVASNMRRIISQWRDNYN